MGGSTRVANEDDLFVQAFGTVFAPHPPNPPGRCRWPWMADLVVKHGGVSSGWLYWRSGVGSARSFALEWECGARICTELGLVLTLYWCSVGIAVILHW